MSSVTNTGKIAPLANGPLPKPEGMRGTLIQAISRQSVPAAAMCFVVFGSVLYATMFRRMKKVKAYYSTHNPEEEYEKIKEMGVFKSVKASWQE
ncbi:unnamed protein product [Clavelina lepadiformis]|uniref:Small integral membrane protein 8 n=1 Tax=Clavelina lepadiformis TaxID=159417 RepID=A0ABP0H1L7_CLALP